MMHLIVCSLSNLNTLFVIHLRFWVDFPLLSSRSRAFMAYSSHNHPILQILLNQNIPLYPLLSNPIYSGFHLEMTLLRCSLTHLDTLSWIVMVYSLVCNMIVTSTLRLTTILFGNELLMGILWFFIFLLDYKLLIFLLTVYHLSNSCYIKTICPFILLIRLRGRDHFVCIILYKQCEDSQVRRSIPSLILTTTLADSGLAI